MVLGFDGKETELCPLKTEVAEVARGWQVSLYVLQCCFGTALEAFQQLRPACLRGLQATDLQGWQGSPS